VVEDYRAGRQTTESEGRCGLSDTELMMAFSGEKSWKRQSPSWDTLHDDDDDEMILPDVVRL